MNAMMKGVLLCGLGLSLAACDSYNDSDGARYVEPVAENTEVSFDQVRTSVFARDANDEPVAVNNLNISESSNNQDIEDLYSQ